MKELRNITIPRYILTDAEITRLLGAAMEIMAELDGESDTSELPPLVEALHEEQMLRERKVSLDDIDPK